MADVLLNSLSEGPRFPRRWVCTSNVFGEEVSLVGWCGLFG